MRRALIHAACAAVLLLAVGAASAGAAGFSGSLAVTAVAPDPRGGGALVVSATGAVSAQCTPDEFCGWFATVTTVPAAQACSPQITGSTWVGEAYDDARGRLPQQLAPTWREWPSIQSGGKRACLYVATRGSDVLAAETTYDVPPPPGTQPGPSPSPPPPTPSPPVPRPGQPAPAPGAGSVLEHGPIPRAVGLRRRFPYRLATGGVPPGVDGARYTLLARTAAARWGLRAAGTTPRAPRSGDRRDTVGFARDVPRGALGITRIRSVRYYRRGASGRLRVVGERVLERDLSLAYGVPWHAGPGLPPRDRVDLQTVLIHELGHYAGNDHVRNCRNSPMWVGLRPGEWWWSRGDWFQFGCPNAPSVPATATATAARAAARPGGTTAAPGARRPLLVERSVKRVVLG